MGNTETSELRRPMKQITTNPSTQSFSQRSHGHSRRTVHQPVNTSSISNFMQVKRNQTLAETLDDESLLCDEAEAAEGLSDSWDYFVQNDTLNSDESPQQRVVTESLTTTDSLHVEQAGAEQDVSEEPPRNEALPHQNAAFQSPSPSMSEVMNPAQYYTPSPPLQQQPHQSKTTGSGTENKPSRKRKAPPMHYSSSPPLKKTPPTQTLKFSQDDTSPTQNPGMQPRVFPLDHIPDEYRNRNILPPAIRAKLYERDVQRQQNRTRNGSPQHHRISPQQQGGIVNVIKFDKDANVTMHQHQTHTITGPHPGRRQQTVINNNIHIRFDPVPPMAVPPMHPVVLVPMPPPQTSSPQSTNTIIADSQPTQTPANVPVQAPPPQIHPAAIFHVQQQQNSDSTSFVDYQKVEEKIFVHSASRTVANRIVSITTKRNSSQKEELKYKLTDEQSYILQQALSGKSLFCSGFAGTGKSLLLRQLTQRLQEKHGVDKVYVCAPTGVAAINIEGVTLHSLFGIKVGESETNEEYATRVYEHKLLRNRIMKMRVVIVDEISMVDGEMLDSIEFMCRTVRTNYAKMHPRIYRVDQFEKPFGGIQFICFGDFLQLPPVSRHKTKEVKFAFDAECWEHIDHHTFCLSKILRQDSLDFIQLLAEVRYGHVTPKMEHLLRSRINAQLESGVEGVIPTKLYAKKKNVQEENDKFLAALPGNSITYSSTDDGDKFLLRLLQKNCPAPKDLQLKVGAQVMLVKNLDIRMGLVNGTRGVVIGFEDEEGHYPRVRFDAGRDRVVEQIVEPLDFFVKLGVHAAWRQQLPLVLAWAMTIHKSQGLTLRQAEVCLDGIFECGQAYVALSRCASLEGLSIVGGFDVSRFMTHHCCTQYMERKEEVNGLLRMGSAEVDDADGTAKTTTTAASALGSMRQQRGQSAQRRSQDASVAGPIVEGSDKFVDDSLDPEDDDEEIDFEELPIRNQQREAVKSDVQSDAAVSPPILAHAGTQVDPIVLD